MWRSRLAVGLVVALLPLFASLPPTAAATRPIVMINTGRGIEHFSSSLDHTSQSDTDLAFGGLFYLTHRAIEIRPPQGATLSPGTFLTTTSAPDAVFGQLTVSGGTCSSPLPGAVIIDAASTTDHHLDSYSIRFYLPCADDADTEIGFAWLGDSAVVGRAVGRPDLYFPTQTTGIESAPLQVRILNAGTEPLEVFDVVTSTEQLVVDNDCTGLVLDFGEQCDLWVRMHPIIPNPEDRVRDGWIEVRDTTTVEFPRGYRVSFKWQGVYRPAWFLDGPAAIDGDLIPLVGDFDGDGLDHDIVWWGPGSGADDSVWRFLDGIPTVDRRSLPWADGYWAITGNFNANSKTEVVFYGIGSRPDVMWSENATLRGAQSPLSIGGDLVPVPGDFDGDGFSDILWYAPGRRHHPIWYFRSDGTYDRFTLAFGGNYDDVISSDLDGDGGKDLIFWREDRDEHPAWVLHGRTRHATRTLAAATAAYPVSISLNSTSSGDDLLWWRPGRTKHRIAFASTRHTPGPIISAPASSIPRVGNFDGDNNGRTDVVWWNLAGDEEVARGGANKLGPREDLGLTDYDSRWSVVGHFQESTTADALDIIWYNPGWARDGLYRGLDIDFPAADEAARSTGRTRGSRPDITTATIARRHSDDPLDLERTRSRHASQ